MPADKNSIDQLFFLYSKKMRTARDACGALRFPIGCAAAAVVAAAVADRSATGCLLASPTFNSPSNYF